MWALETTSTFCFEPTHSVVGVYTASTLRPSCLTEMQKIFLYEFTGCLSAIILSTAIHTIAIIVTITWKPLENYAYLYSSFRKKGKNVTVLK